VHVHETFGVVADQDAQQLVGGGTVLRRRSGTRSDTRSGTGSAARTGRGRARAVAGRSRHGSAGRWLAVHVEQRYVVGVR
jgi:hypothetical protein